MVKPWTFYGNLRIIKQSIENCERRQHYGKSIWLTNTKFCKYCEKIGKHSLAMLFVYWITSDREGWGDLVCVKSDVKLFVLDFNGAINVLIRMVVGGGRRETLIGCPCDTKSTLEWPSAAYYSRLVAGDEWVTF